MSWALQESRAAWILGPKEAAFLWVNARGARPDRSPQGGAPEERGRPWWPGLHSAVLLGGDTAGLRFGQLTGPGLFRVWAARPLVEEGSSP